jgi:uncharacterized protein (TIGR03790 family)
VGIAFFMLCLSFEDLWALAPSEIMVVVNGRIDAGREIASDYMRHRRVPMSNLLEVRTTTTEAVSRRDYEAQIAAPARTRLRALASSQRIRCLLLIFGLPLRVLPEEPSPDEVRQLESLRQQRATVAAEIERLKAQGAPDEEDRLRLRIAQLDAEAARLQRSGQSASLDSEMALLMAGPYPLSGWIANPAFIGPPQAWLRAEGEPALMVSRLDGPDPGTVRRMVADSLSAEKTGLEGVAYFDARWPGSADSPKNAYGYYDRSIHLAAEIVRRSGRLPVVLDESESLFQPGECPDAALYCGWYSLGRYVDAFTWRAGAVGFHIASSECASLKTPGGTGWCRRMVEKGAAATIGPVEEPYVQAFPVPEIFFRLLIEGRLTLAECYAASTPFLSWRMILIGDPLYRPFAAGPKGDGQVGKRPQAF